MPLTSLPATQAAGALRDPEGRAPLTFFALVFALSVPFWVLGAATGLQLTADLPMSSFVWFCPVIAAAILVYREHGAPGVVALLRRSFDFARIRERRWYVPAVLLLPGVYAATYGVMRAMGVPLPPVHVPVLAGPRVVLRLLHCRSVRGAGLVGLRPRSAAGALDRAGGRSPAGIGLGRLSPRAVDPGSPLPGVDRLVGAGYGGVTSALLVALQHRGSVFATGLFHATGNIAQIGPFLDFGPGGYPLEAQRIAALLLAAGAVVVTIIWGPRTLAPP